MEGARPGIRDATGSLIMTFIMIQERQAPRSRTGVARCEQLVQVVVFGPCQLENKEVAGAFKVGNPGKTCWVDLERPCAAGPNGLDEVLNEVVFLLSLEH